jgi:hypothetical protein
LATVQASSSASSFIQLSDLVSAFIGAALALVGQWLIQKAAKAWKAKRLSLAFWEELSAVNFYGPPQHAPNFAGFSSQTFDSLFSELAESLPETLARDVMRYHWRMKFLDETKSGGGTPHLQFWNEAKSLHEVLLVRFDHHKRRKVPTLMFWPWETCDKALIKGS